MSIKCNSERCSGLPATPQPDQRAALVALYNATGGAGWTKNTGWLSDRHPCTWYGVTCNGDVVTQLRLSQNSLSGTMPSQLGELGALTALELSQNSLSGTIPTELRSITSRLQPCLLYGNQFPVCDSYSSASEDYEASFYPCQVCGGGYSYFG